MMCAKFRDNRTKTVGVAIWRKDWWHPDINHLGPYTIAPQASSRDKKEILILALVSNVRVLRTRFAVR